MFVRDLVLDASIGVYAHEHETLQRIRINLDLSVVDDGGAHRSHCVAGPDDLARVVDYEAIVVRAREIVKSGHVQLVETLAERLARTCLDDARVLNVRVRVEKLDVFVDAASTGVEIERWNS
ncbi:diguanylate cyclase [Acidocella aquatica]|uniref:dihydroneopterin aldolase n=2 Tax=Acidocella aquatica TaxID=1922313 RepID=A0ABQ6A6F6_9PROT|nr:diguanylate cyclase [Acidocella aquatica]